MKTWDEIKGNKAVLQRGDSGEAVTKMQELLSKAGFGVAVTDIFGTTTEKQLIKFQEKYHIQATGKFGETTLTALENVVKHPHYTDNGVRLANEARKEANNRGTVGKCYNAVATAMERVLPPFLSGMSAWMAADQLAAKTDLFKEVKVQAEKLPQLPAGAVIVWGQTNVSVHGHISICLGNGQEASDHIEPQRTQLRGYKNYRVFMPI